MLLPQPGIFALGSRSHYYLEFDLRPGVDPRELVRAVDSLEEPKRTTGGANIVVGFGATLWGQVAPDRVPAGLAPFAVIGPPTGPHAPASQHDVWVWAHGPGYDVVFDVARMVVRGLEPLAVLATEQPAFTYLDSRDLTGFIDGTENPPVDAAHETAIVPDGPGAGGSFVLVQRWVHDLAAFHALADGEQEQVFGRTKADSEELAERDRPVSAHISRVVVNDDAGDELEVFRRSTSFGTVVEHGLVFVAFSRDIDRLDLMLRRMFGVADGVYDRLTEFSRPMSGAYYFAPSVQELHAAAG